MQGQIIGEHTRSNWPEASDPELVRGTLNGDAGAFEAIMRRYNQRLFRLARSVMRDEGEAEDIVQEAYVRAYSSLAGLSDPTSLGAWLGRIVMNEAISRKRGQSRFADAPGASGDERSEGFERLLNAARPTAPNPEDLAAMTEIRRLVEQAIDELPDAFRSVFVLRAVEQMSTAETAEYLEISPQTVKTRLHRGRQLLQAALSDQITSATLDAFPFAGRRCDRTVARVLEQVGLVHPPHKED
ncbi:MAG: RNA polymerase sigma factor [Rhodovibrionaceae bacterium]|nr:RNA polymerase sigma factor [Rhodovibrionaceae bacterium]